MHYSLQRWAGMEPTPNFTVGTIDGWMDDLRFYVLFNSISVISGRCLGDNERLLCNGTSFTVEKISPRVRVELGPLDQ